MNEVGSETQFDFTYAPGISTEQIIGFEMAGAIWSSYLQDDITVRIYVESTDQLPENVVGAALPAKKETVNYKDLRDKMSDDITSGNDQLAFDHLPAVQDKFSIVVNGTEIVETEKFKLTNVNAKLLNFLEADYELLDGYIVVDNLTGNSNVTWDYDALRGDDIQDNEIDFLSVAMHEIGHVLGFVSGIDDDGWLELLTKYREENKSVENDDFEFNSPLDLFRYSEFSANMGIIDLSTGGNPFFSIDGGYTRLGNFANGQSTEFGGDGYQASHWQQNSSQGIMNPILPMGQRKDISDLDLIAMDVIGWDIDPLADLNWAEIHQIAIARSETAIIADRSQDVEDLIADSNYDVRRTRSTTKFDYYWQAGMWQYTTFQSITTPEVFWVEEDEAADYLANNNSVEDETLGTSRVLLEQPSQDVL